MDHLARLKELSVQVGENPAGTDRAVLLGELQRTSTLALHDAISSARAEGGSWRALASALRMASATLHRQFRSGNGINALGGVPAAAEARVERVEPFGPRPRLDRFVGRDVELADLRPLLAGNRLVTLTGPGGVGKTRLLTEFVHDRYRGRVWWTELAPLSCGGQVENAVRQVLRGDSRPTAELLSEVDDPAVLVLDNCEHVVDACAELVAELLARCPRLRVLTTSREPLRVPGEVAFPVRPLPRTDSVRLFTERMRGIAGQTAEYDAVAELCARLDDLPLAIELAAGVSAVLSPARLLDRLNDRLDLLSGGPRCAPRRHHGLREVIAWSYDLLDERERAVFRRLAVLPGGFDTDGAATLCADLALPVGGLERVLADLVAKSLLAPGTEEGRFRLLDSLCVFGRDQLTAEDELSGAHDRLLAWLADLAPRPFRTFAELEELNFRLTREQHNLAYAVRVAGQTGDELCGPLSAAFAVCLVRAGELDRAHELLATALTGPTTEIGRAGVLVNLAEVSRLRGRCAEGRDLAKRALVLARLLGQPCLEYRALGQLTMACSTLGEREQAAALGEELVDCARRVGWPPALVFAHCMNTWQLLDAGRVDDAEAGVAEALTLLERNPGWIPEALSAAGAVALEQGDRERARACFTAVLNLPARNVVVLIQCLEGIALLTGDQRLFAAAAQARQRSQLTAHPWWAARCTVAHHQQPSVWSLDEAVSHVLHDNAPAPDPVLTAREHQVVELVAQGLTNRQVAARLGIAARTVVNHLEHVRAKLDLPTRSHITAWVVRNQ